MACFCICFEQPGSPFVCIPRNLKFPGKRNHLHICTECKVRFSKSTYLKPKVTIWAPHQPWGKMIQLKLWLFLDDVCYINYVVKNVRKHLIVRKIIIQSLWRLIKRLATNLEAFIQQNLWKPNKNNVRLWHLSQGL